MKLTFSKYHGTGNDFILIDNREGNIKLSGEEIAWLCHRHFGIGADGLMFLTSEPHFDFGMKYYNSDGHESTMCGNGGRCITAFAHALGIVGNTARLLAIDGEHQSEILKDEGSMIWIRLKMRDVPNHEVQVSDIKTGNSSFVINTGSPHLVIFTDNVMGLDVVSKGRKLQNDPQFAPEGINVDFVEITDNGLFVRTYERGVEDETLSCGTGVAAAAIAVGSRQWAVGSSQWAVGSEQSAVGSEQSAVGSPQLSDSTGVIARNEETKQTRPGTRIEIDTPGGKLTVSFRQEGDSFTDIWLEGPAEFVFHGEVEMKSKT